MVTSRSNFGDGSDPLLELREKAVAIKTCMSLTMEEVEKLILGDMVVKGLDLHHNHLYIMLMIINYND